MNNKYNEYLDHFPNLSKFDEKDPYLDNLKLLAEKKYNEVKEQCMQNLDCSYFLINLSYLYKNQKDIKNAIKYYTMAAKKGNNIAMNNLGYLYKKQKDIKNAIKYYTMAIEKGNINAMNNLGCLYHKQKDFENAIKYYTMAIKKGNIKTMNNLGYLYKKQKSVKNTKILHDDN